MSCQRSVEKTYLFFFLMLLYIEAQHMLTKHRDAYLKHIFTSL
ncbi:unnamed protein product [Arabidopsis halleri]